MPTEKQDDLLGKIDQAIDRLKLLVESGAIDRQKITEIKTKLREEARVLLSLIADKPEQNPELIDLVGVRGGVETPLGKIPLPPSFKIREIATAQFGAYEPGDCSDAELCAGAMEEFYTWLKANGMAI